MQKPTRRERGKPRENAEMNEKELKTKREIVMEFGRELNASKFSNITEVEK